METYALLEHAIAHREQVIATYDGERREFCPHVLGTKNGARHVLGYQFRRREQARPAVRRRVALL